MLRHLPALALLLLPTGSSAREEVRPTDRILLRDGQEIVGHLLLEHDGQVVVRVKRKERTYSRAEVSEIVSPLVSMDEYVRRARIARAEGLRGWESLMAWCRDEGLEREARLAALGVLRHDYESAEAHELLGSKRKRGEWRLDYGGQRLAREEWFEGPVLTWSNAAELDTTLYTLLSNASASRTLEIVTDLAWAHQAWYALFGDPLGQRHRVELFEVSIHGEDDSYPNRPGDPLAYFDSGDDRIEIDASRSVGAREVHHEVAHQCFSDLAVQLGVRAEDLPVWLDEGMAEVLARVCMADLEPDASAEWLRSADHYGVLAARDEEPRLGVLMSYGPEDFHGAQDAEQRYALAYTLVVLCLDEPGSVRRARFFAYVQDLAAGRVDPDRLPAALSLEPDQLERIWRESLPPPNGGGR